MKSSDRASSIQEYYFSRKMKEIKKLDSEGKQIINLGIGNPDLSPHFSFKKSLVSEIEVSDSYKYQPYDGITELKKELHNWYSQTYGLSIDKSFSSIPLIGSKEGIHFLTLAYLNPGDNALIPNPGYPAYNSAIKLAGGIPRSYSLSAEGSWHPKIEELKELVDDKTKIIFINYPHMPTGVKPDKEKLNELLQFASKKNILICNDNPYSQILTKTPFSVFQLENSYSNCLELNSLSKSSSLAGARIGMISGKTTLLEPVFKIQTSFSSGMFKPLQKAAVQALKHSQEYTRSINETYKKRRLLVWELLDSLDCHYEKTTNGMFVWASYKHNLTSYEYADELLKQHGIFFAPGEVFGTEGKGYVRASLCNSTEQIKNAIKRTNPKTK